MEQNNATIGQSVIVTGELTAGEDLTIEGRVEGTIDLDQNVLTIGANGQLKAQVSAKVVIVMGKVTGNITTAEAINIRETATVDGDLVAPKIGIAEGASFRGKIDMRPSKAQRVPWRSRARPGTLRPPLRDKRSHSVTVAGACAGRHTLRASLEEIDAWWRRAMPEMLNRPRDQRFLFLLIHGIATYSQEPRSPSPRTTSFGYQLFQIGPNKREPITDGRKVRLIGRALSLAP